MELKATGDQNIHATLFANNLFVKCLVLKTYFSNLVVVGLLQDIVEDFENRNNHDFGILIEIRLQELGNRTIDLGFGNCHHCIGRSSTSRR